MGQGFFFKKNGWITHRMPNMKKIQQITRHLET